MELPDLTVNIELDVEKEPDPTFAYYGLDTDPGRSCQRPEFNMRFKMSFLSQFFFSNNATC